MYAYQLCIIKHSEPDLRAVLMYLNFKNVEEYEGQGILLWGLRCEVGGKQALVEARITQARGVAPAPAPAPALTLKQLTATQFTLIHTETIFRWR